MESAASRPPTPPGTDLVAAVSRWRRATRPSEETVALSRAQFKAAQNKAESGAVIVEKAICWSSRGIVGVDIAARA